MVDGGSHMLAESPVVSSIAGEAEAHLKVMADQIRDLECNVARLRAARSRIPLVPDGPGGAEGIA